MKGAPDSLLAFQKSCTRSGFSIRILDSGLYVLIIGNNSKG